MEKIKIKFTDFWTPFDEKDESYSELFDLVTSNFPVELSDDPDYVICSCFGSEYMKYPNAVRILFLGENIFPNFNLYDYAIGFHYISFEDRYLRFPLYWLYKSDCERAKNKHLLSDESDLADRDFCGFVSSHVCNLRDNFFKALSEYKQVSSGGPWMNNIGGTIGSSIEDKYCWQKQFKFVCCPENSITNGYVTEKLLQAFSAQTVPIYLGPKDAVKDFNTKAFINASDYNSYSDVIKYVSEVDTSTDLYLSMLKEPAFITDNAREKACKELINFFTEIFSQEKGVAFRRHLDREWGLSMDINNQERCLAVRQKYWRLKHLENTILQKEYGEQIYSGGKSQALFNILAGFFMH